VRTGLFLGLALGAGVLVVALLPRPPDDAVTVPVYEGWSPQQPRGSGRIPSYPVVHDVPYQGPQTWRIGPDSSLTWTLDPDASVGIFFPLEGDLVIDSRRLSGGGGSLRLGAAVASSEDVQRALATAGDPGGPLLLEFVGDGPMAVTAGDGLSARLRGNVGPLALDIESQLALSRPDPATLVLRGSFNLDSASYIWSSEWELLRSTLDAQGFSSGNTTVDLVIQLRRGAP
jgi:hypothetical protein